MESVCFVSLLKQLRKLCLMPVITIVECKTSTSDKW